jgi:RHS repeat-associated protein
MRKRTLLFALVAGCLAAIPARAQTISANCSTISGTQSAYTQLPFNFDIYDGPVQIAQVAAFAKYGFSMNTPAALKDNQPHNLYWYIDGAPQFNAGPFALTCPVNAPGYVYDYTDTFPSPLPSVWQQNGVTPTCPSSTCTGLSNDHTNGNGTAVIYTPTVPGTPNGYEVKMTLQLKVSGGVYSMYHRASSNALESPNTGTYYVTELQNPTPGGTGTLALYRVVNGSATLLAQTSVPCHDGMTVRAILRGDGNYWAYVDNWFYMFASGLNTAIPSGQPGFGVRSTPIGNLIVEGDIGHQDTVAPNAPNTAQLALDVTPNRVQLQWPGVADDPNGTGVSMYGVYRNGSWIAYVTYPEFEDDSVAAGATYTYQLVAFDFHQNYTWSSSFSVTTPPAGTIDPLRTGVTALAPTWGGTGENIDMRSGNLNYTVPLLKPIGRGGLSVPVNLAYNSQFWRENGSNTWRESSFLSLGPGWTLQAGSLTPYYDNLTWNAPLYFLFVDNTGAQYRLDQVSNGVYSSIQSIYLWFDTNTHLLHFKDGSTWTFGCISAGTENDAGTMYPTIIEDTFGNGIAIRYADGAGTSWPDSSSRIGEIEDTRSTKKGPDGLPASYAFTYNGTTLSGISNYIGSAESYTFATTSIAPLDNPFTGSAWAPSATSLGSLTQTSTGEITYFSYDSSGELAQVTLPHGGHIRWSYTTMNYTGSDNLREVQNRYLQIASGSGTEYTYNLSHPSGDSSLSFHSQTTLADVTGNATKNWFFGTSSGAGFGQATAFEESTTGSTTPTHIAYAYAQDAASNWYPSQITAYINYTSSTNQQSKVTTQTLDRYGNVTSMKKYDWNAYGTANPLLSYTNTYMHGPDSSPGNSYDTAYCRNNISTSTVSDGTYTPTLVSNSFQSAQYCGHPSSVVTPTASTSIGYDQYGNVTSQTTNGTASSTTMDSTNTVPAEITVGSSYSQTMTWSSFLGLTSVTGQNNDSAQISYSGSGLPSSTVSPYGATTNVTYHIYNTNGDGLPTTTTSITNTHFTRQTLDGLGHVILQEQGTVSGSTLTTVSQVSSVYAPCGCSPMGKLSQVSQPYAPGGQPVWTVYAYDGMGRTLSVTLPDGSVTHYSYDDLASSSNASDVTTTDPASKVKRFQLNGLGQLTQVIEDPSGLAYATLYTYDALGHLYTVKQTRGSNTQTRTFSYVKSGALTGFLQSATNPENGTVSYTYNANNLLATKTDANGNVIQYNYDSYSRLTSFGTVVNGTYTPAYTYTWDSGGANAVNQTGRLAQVSYSNPASPNTDQIVETYSYTTAGEIAFKDLAVTRPCQYPSCVAHLTLSATYDTEGHRTQYSVPTASPGDGGQGAFSVMNYSYDAMERATGMTDNATGDSYVSGITYNAANQLLTMTYTPSVTNGGGTSESRTYNNLLQLTGISGGGISLTYNYTAGQDNGKIASQYNAISGETVQYVYDSLNRLSSATGSNWGDSYVYDGFGNLLQKNVTKGSAPTLTQTVNPVNNQINGRSYDANGNDVTVNLQHYDFLNRMISYGGTYLNEYGYDASNRRIYKAAYSGSTLQTEGYILYGLDGENLGTYTPVIYNNGSGQAGLLLEQATGRTYFFGKKLWTTEDNVGSAASGGTFWPWGEQRTGSSSEQYGFGTYWQDGESGLDYAGHRFYSPSIGRFLTPDPMGKMAADPKDPQSWNRYAYVEGDPINMSDRTGLGPTKHPSWWDAPNGCQAFSQEPCGPGAQGGGTECIVDGADIPCDAMQSLLQAGAALLNSQYTAWWDSVSTPPASYGDFTDDLENPNSVGGASQVAYWVLQIPSCGDLFNLPDGMTVTDLLNEVDITYNPQNTTNLAQTWSPQNSSTGTELINFNTNPASGYSNLSPGQAANLIIHELLHAAYDLYGPSAVPSNWTQGDGGTSFQSSSGQAWNDQDIMTACGLPST